MGDEVKSGAESSSFHLGRRDLFSRLEAGAYFNHAAISPLADPVRAAMAEAADDYAARGTGAIARWAGDREELRQGLARLLGGAVEGVALVPNTTFGVRSIAFALDYRPGDRILLFTDEFPANVTPFQQAARTFELTVEWVPISAFVRDPEEGLSRVHALLEMGRVRLAAFSAVQFRSGLRMPVEALAALCRDAGASVFVDAAQSLGIVPDRLAAHADFVAGTGHKYLLGPEGTGYLYVHPERAERLRPRLAGWLSHERALSFLVEGPGELRYDRPFRKDARVFEDASPNVVGLAGLRAGVKLVETVGVAAIHRHVQAILDQLEPPLLAMGLHSYRSPHPERRGGALCLRLPSHVDGPRLLAELRERGVIAALPDGVLRFSPHFIATEEEARRVAVAMEESLPIASAG